MLIIIIIIIIMTINSKIVTQVRKYPMVATMI